MLQVVSALQTAGVMVLGGPRAVGLGVVTAASPGFKTEYGEMANPCPFIQLAP